MCVRGVGTESERERVSVCVWEKLGEKGGREREREREKELVCVKKRVNLCACERDWVCVCVLRWVGVKKIKGLSFTQ